MGKIYIICKENVYSDSDNFYYPCGELDSHPEPVVAYDDRESAYKAMKKLNKNFDIEKEYDWLLKIGYTIEEIKECMSDYGSYYIDELPLFRTKKENKEWKK